MDKRNSTIASIILFCITIGCIIYMFLAGNNNIISQLFYTLPPTIQIITISLIAIFWIVLFMKILFIFNPLSPTPQNRFDTIIRPGSRARSHLFLLLFSIILILLLILFK